MGTSVTSMFSGNSRYASDFKSVIDRAVAIASLPLNLIQAQKSTLQDQADALTGLNTKTTSLQTAIESLTNATGSTSYSASISDGTIVSASLGSGVAAGSYSVEVTRLGSYNNAISVDGSSTVRDPALGNISTATSFTLSTTAGSVSITATNLNDLVKQINNSGLGVQASVVNVRSPSDPDYHLSIQGTKLGALGISLKDDASTPNELLDTLAGGATAAYKISGYSTAAESSTRSIEISPGLTINLLKESTAGTATTVTVSRSTSSVQNALSSFVSAFNAAVDEVDKHRGSANGALSGNSIVYTVAEALADIQGFTPGSGPFTSLEDLGVKIGNKDGKLTFDTATFTKATTGRIDDLMNFLGGAKTGGFLTVATNAMNSLRDADKGALALEINGTNDQISAQNTRISEQQERINLLQKNLESQMAAADALIAQLEQQANYINSMFSAMSEASKQYSQ